MSRNVQPRKIVARVKSQVTSVNHSREAITSDEEETTRAKERVYLSLRVARIKLARANGGACGHASREETRELSRAKEWMKVESSREE